MKYLTLIGLLLSTPVQANESYCDSIQNTDKKNFCLGIVKSQESYCYSVQESDSKNMCLAQVKRLVSYCYSISSSDVKTFVWRS
jgi:hypothetical protein